jgi:hypothetical protein
MATDPYAAAAPYLDYFVKASQESGVPLDLLLAQAQQESGFNPNAVSPAGAQGISQFMPGTAKEYGIDARDPAQSIAAQAQYIKKGLDLYGGDEAKALASYNAGFGNVNKYGGVPPFKETQGYVQRIGANREGWRNHLAQLGMLPDAVTQNLAAIPPDVQAEALSGSLPGTPVAGIDAKPKGNFINNLSGVLAALSGAGGLFANTVGAFKGTGQPGDAAIRQSTSLLDVLNERQRQADAYASLTDYVKSTKLPPDVAAAALAAGKTDPKKGLEIAYGPSLANQKTQADINEAIQKETNPKLRAAKVENVAAEAGAREGAKAAADSKQIQEYLNLTQKEGKTKGDELRLKVMEKSLGVDKKDPDPFAQVAKEQAVTQKFEALPEVKRARVVNSYAQRSNDLFNQYKNNKANYSDLNGMDQVLINSLAKINDELTGVKEAEYLRTPQSLSLINRIKGWQEQLAKGGSGMTDGDRQNIIKTLNIVNKSSNKSFNKYYEPLTSSLKAKGIEPEFLPGAYEAPEDAPAAAQPSNGAAPAGKYQGLSNDEIMKRLSL